MKLLTLLKQNKTLMKKDWEPIKTQIKQKYPSQFFNKIYELGGFIAGGYAKQLLFSASDIIRRDNEMKNIMLASDVDIFCKTKESYSALSEFLHTHIMFTNTIDGLFESFYFNEQDFHEDVGLMPQKVQLILPTDRPNAGDNLAYGTPTELIKGFDFSVCAAAVEKESDGTYSVIMHPELLYDIFAKTLRIISIRCPVALVWRIMKYVRKGFYLPTEDLSYIFKYWDDRLGAKEKEEILQTSMNLRQTKSLLQFIKAGNLNGLNETQGLINSDYDKLYKLIRFD